MFGTTVTLFIGIAGHIKLNVTSDVYIYSLPLDPIDHSNVIILVAASLGAIIVKS